MIYFLGSILVLTAVFSLLRKIKIFSFCPICAAAVITWAGGLAALYFNLSWASPLLVGILMGASLGAVAEKYGGKYGFIWKTAVVILGFPAVYFLVSKDFYKGIILMAVLIMFTFLKKVFAVRAEKEDLFEDCCD